MLTTGNFFSKFHPLGFKTGKCTDADKGDKKHKVCEIYSWCPVEIDELPMPGFNLRYVLKCCFWSSAEPSYSKQN